MAVILNIDSSTKTASVSIAENGSLQHFVSNDSQKDHASFLHTGIRTLLGNARLQLNDMNAIAVTAGPGSYTGLRVGMAAAKGLSYAAKKPFITVSTLTAMARALINTGTYDNDTLFCPLIDARRMEVFTAVYDKQMNEVLAPCAMILEERSFKDILAVSRVLFFGTGAIKLENLLQNDHAVFAPELGIIAAIGELSFEKYTENRFTDLVYSEPSYLKDFYSGH